MCVWTAQARTDCMCDLPQNASKSHSPKVVFWCLFGHIFQHGRKGLQRVSKACQNGALGCPKGDQGFPLGAQAVAKGAQGVPKDAHSVPRVDSLETSLSQSGLPGRVRSRCRQYHWVRHSKIRQEVTMSPQQGFHARIPRKDSTSRIP